MQILRYVVFERRLTTHSIRGEGAYYSVLGCGIIHFDEKVMTKFHLDIHRADSHSQFTNMYFKFVQFLKAFSANRVYVISVQVPKPVGVHQG